MSGIAVIVGQVDDIEYRLAAMLRSHTHCGCENKGFWVSSFVESRLGIAGCGCMSGEGEEQVHQPYIDDEAQMVVLLDGDIYNHKELREVLQSHYTLATNSKVELVSKAYLHWGRNFLCHLEGAFVVVIYDRRCDELMIARDRFGVKPLYYATQRGNLFFATEVHTLFAGGVERRVSAEQWAGYMLYSSYGEPYTTFWSGVRQLPAATLLVHNGYSMSEYIWYDLYDDIVELVVDNTTEELSQMLIAEMVSCTEHSMSDVSACGLRVGTRIESQLLHHLALRGQHGWKVHTFTGDVDSVGRHPIATPIWVTAHHAIDELERMSQWVEEPVDGSESIVRIAMFRYARQYGVRMVCSGVGLDVLWQDVWDESELQYNYVAPLPLFTPDFVHCAMPPRYRGYFGHEIHDSRYLELRYEHLPHQLRLLNRAATEAGVSVRLPFLSSRLVALSFALPMSCHCRRRELFSRCVVEHCDCDFERGESYSPIALWLKGGVREWVGDALSDLRNGRAREWFDARCIESLWQQFDAGECIDMALLWKCISLQSHLAGGR